MSGFVLHAKILVYLILLVTQLGRYCCYPHSIDEQTKAEVNLYKTKPDSLAPEPMLYLCKCH